MSESGNEFDNESSLRAARKNLPFAKLLAGMVAGAGRPADGCPFCTELKTSGLIRRAITTKKIDRASIAAVEAVDIVKVVQASLQLKRQGANWVACCPFHNEKHPSFNVHPAKNLFKCFGCKEGGGVIQFTMKMAGMEFVPAVEKLASENGIQLRYETHGERVLWRCTNPGCPSATSKEGSELDEVGLVGLWEGLKTADQKPLSRKEAFKAYLRMADVTASRPPEDRPQRFKPTPKADTSPRPSPQRGEGENVLPNPVIPPTVEPVEEKPVDDEDLIWQCIEVIRKENRASVALLQRKLKVGAKADRIMAELEKRGIVGAANGSKPREILKLPKPRPQLIKIKIGEEVHIVDAAPVTSPPPASQSEGEDAEFTPGDFTAQELPDGTLLGRAALEYFYARQELLPADDDKIFAKRGLVTAANRALGFVSSGEKNFDLLYAMSNGANPDIKSFDMHELIASGLWLPEDKKKKKPRRPNAQFCGFGQLGKKAKADRRGKDDKIIWGTSYPVLIPYFDERGKIFKLRPHKGGAPGQTLCGANRVYIPRDYRALRDGDAQKVGENFYKVVICEGEFKAAAIWQTLGTGRTDGERPLGVCALPGINFGKNYDLREELEAWLQTVGCEHFVVAFDDEDKTDKPLRERHEAVIWAKFLAASLAKKLQINGQVCVLPKAWRIKDGKTDPKGKADWDGALATIVHQK